MIISIEARNVHAEEKEMSNYKAITNDSKNKRDFKDVTPSKTFNDFCKDKIHTEFLCEMHMKDRLLNYCNQDSLVDVMMSGIRALKFIHLEDLVMDCKNCGAGNLAQYRIDRIE